MFLVGHDAVEFHRQFADRGMESQCARFSTLMEESMLQKIGTRAAQDVFVASGYFEALPAAESLDFGARYVRRFGPGAPVLNAPGESGYKGLWMLAVSASPDVQAPRAGADVGLLLRGLARCRTAAEHADTRHTDLPQCLVERAAIGTDRGPLRRSAVATTAPGSPGSPLACPARVCPRPSSGELEVAPPGPAG
ncbi:ABC transporter substrate-binding protein, partial [Pseudonocardia halophobica]|uniref:ABC transporter substrate-binding protein n=1 Tax=Pseudonocardia halophobica TaxID=29401 RepID=UPI0022F333AD